MKNKRKLIKKIVKLLVKQIPLFIGLSVVYYAYTITTQEQRQKIWFAVQHAHYEWLVLSMILGLLSHWWRAARWHILLKPLEANTKQSNRFPITMVAYLANLGVPRSGEVLRAAMLSKREDIAFEKAAGTIIVERLLDALILMLFIVVTFFINPQLIRSMLPDALTINYWVLLLIVIFFAIAFIYLMKRKPKYYQRIKSFLKDLKKSIVGISNMDRKGMFIFYTVLIWFAYLTMIWLPCYSLDQVGALPFGIVLMAFVAGSLAIVFTNGGIGVFPLAIATVLAYSGIPEVYGEAFGWLVWVNQTLLIVVGGALSYLYLKLKKY